MVLGQTRRDETRHIVLFCFSQKYAPKHPISDVARLPESSKSSRALSSPVMLGLERMPATVEPVTASLANVALRVRQLAIVMHILARPIMTGSTKSSPKSSPGFLDNLGSSYMPDKFESTFIKV